MHHQTCPVFYVSDIFFSILINTDIDECSLGAADCHSTLAECINTEGSYKCECVDGYAWNGTTCQGKLEVTTTIYMLPALARKPRRDCFVHCCLLLL